MSLLSLLNRARTIRRRSRVVMQASQMDCAPACLTMVLKANLRPTSLSECRRRFAGGRDGTSAREIAAVAETYGVCCQGYGLEKADLEGAQFPAIVHWAGNHYVVVERWSRRKATIVDPAQGRVRISHERFSANFMVPGPGGASRGTLLTFRPTDETPQPVGASARSGWRYIAEAARTVGIRSISGQILCTALILEFLTLSVPILTKVVVDSALPQRLDEAFDILALGILMLVVSSLVTTYLRSALLLQLQARVDAGVMLNFFRHVVSLPYQFFEERSRGDLVMRLVSNTSLRDILSTQVLGSVLDGGLAVTYAAILLVVDRSFGLVALAIAGFQVVLLLLTARPMFRRVQEDLQAQAESQSYLVEALSGIASIKAGGSEDSALYHWAVLFGGALRASLRRGQLFAVVGGLSASVRTFSPLVLLWVGGRAVLSGGLSLGTALALVALGTTFLAAVASLAGTAQQLQLVGGYLDRLADVWNTEPEKRGAVRSEGTPLRGRLELRDVSFRFSADGPWALDNISLRVEPGQKIAIVGRTGSGKSTLGKVLLGFYVPQRGQVLYDGVPLEELDLRSVRHQIGTVLQESSLFRATVAENIAFNRSSLRSPDVEAAAAIAEIAGEIAAMPMGYGTLVGEDGGSISGGQQRLLLARAVAARPPLLLLDEATSDLDTLTEANVDRNLASLGCTRIMITHRLATLGDAEKVVVLEQGREVAQGTHDRLMAESPQYADLILTQVDRDGGLA